MFQQFVEFLNWGFSSLGTTFGNRAPETISLFQSVVQWMAIVLSALAGVYEARRRELDFFGSFVIAFTSSLTKQQSSDSPEGDMHATAKESTAGMAENGELTHYRIYPLHQ